MRAAWVQFTPRCPVTVRTEQDTGQRRRANEDQSSCSAGELGTRETQESDRSSERRMSAVPSWPEASGTGVFGEALPKLRLDG